MELHVDNVGNMKLNISAKVEVRIKLELQTCNVIPYIVVLVFVKPTKEKSRTSKLAFIIFLIFLSFECTYDMSFCISFNS
jgi:hypothetical protein